MKRETMRLINKLAHARTRLEYEKERARLIRSAREMEDPDRWLADQLRQASEQVAGYNPVDLEAHELDNKTLDPTVTRGVTEARPRSGDAEGKSANRTKTPPN